MTRIGQLRLWACSGDLQQPNSANFGSLLAPHFQALTPRARAAYGMLLYLRTYARVLVRNDQEMVAFRMSHASS